MRARLLPVWPALSHHFGLNPTHFLLLSAAEWNAYIEALHDIADAGEG